MQVVETFFSLEVADMRRAIDFYKRALGAETTFESERWTSLSIANVRIGLFLAPKRSDPCRGLHFAVTDLDAALAAIELAGGRVVDGPMEAAPGVRVASAVDSEGNAIALRLA